MNFIENVAGWKLLFEDARVSQIQIDFQLTLEISDGSEDVRVCIETAGTLQDQTTETQFLPENTESLAPVLSLFNTTALSLEVTKAGRLNIEFQKHALYVNSHPTYEAWTIRLSTKTGSAMLICSPGGAVCVFEEDAPFSGSIN